MCWEHKIKSTPSADSIFFFINEPHKFMGIHNTHTAEICAALQFKYDVRVRFWKKAYIGFCRHFMFPLHRNFPP